MAHLQRSVLAPVDQVILYCASAEDAATVAEAAMTARVSYGIKATTARSVSAGSTATAATHSEVYTSTSTALAAMNEVLLIGPRVQVPDAIAHVAASTAPSIEGVVDAASRNKDQAFGDSISPLLPVWGLEAGGKRTPTLFAARVVQRRRIQPAICRSSANGTCADAATAVLRRVTEHPFLQTVFTVEPAEDNNVVWVAISPFTLRKEGHREMPPSKLPVMVSLAMLLNFSWAGASCVVNDAAGSSTTQHRGSFLGASPVRGGWTSIGGKVNKLSTLGVVSIARLAASLARAWTRSSARARRGAPDPTAHFLQIRGPTRSRAPAVRCRLVTGRLGA